MSRFYKQNHLTTLYFSRHIAPAPSIRNTSNAATNAAMHHMTALPHRARTPPGPARFACQQHDAWASLENSSCQRPPSKPRQQAGAASLSRSSGFFRPQYPPSAQHFTAFRCLAHAAAASVCGFGYPGDLIPVMYSPPVIYISCRLATRARLCFNTPARFPHGCRVPSGGGEDTAGNRWGRR